MTNFIVGKWGGKKQHDKKAAVKRQPKIVSTVLPVSQGFVCYTRSFIYYFFLGSLRISIFTLLEEIEDERVYPEIFTIYSHS